ncbi:dihydrodipicolinate synthase family protein [Atrimonas thermophila]|uniref:dihydrodipicolinate synthase family protein n=1 Tax=Atrimonas thermophila TaxID=3064161 RepID=UPI00399D4E67
MVNSPLKEQLSGVFAPVVTPFRNDEILYHALISNIKSLNNTGLRGYLVLGTNGEFKSLSTKEKLLVLENVVKHAAPDKTIIAGTGAESTRETIELTLEAARIGVSMVSLLMPHFFRKYMDDEALIGYVLEVADVSPVPVMLYNNPSVAADVLVSPYVVEKVSEHPNVVGMKDSSSGNFESYIKASEGKEFYVLAGSANFFLDLLLAGGTGGVLSLANVFPNKCVELYEAFRTGDVERAQELNKKLVALNKKVSGFGGVAAVKAAMNIVGYIGGDPRRPLKPLSGEARKVLEAELKEFGFLSNK